MYTTTLRAMDCIRLWQVPVFPLNVFWRRNGRHNLAMLAHTWYLTRDWDNSCCNVMGTHLLVVKWQDFHHRASTAQPKSESREQREAEHLIHLLINQLYLSYRKILSDQGLDNWGLNCLFLCVEKCVSLLEISGIVILFCWLLFVTFKK